MADLNPVPLESFAIQGQPLNLAALPTGLVSRPELGIVHHERLDAHRLHAWPAPYNASFHPRGIKTPGGDYLVCFSAGQGHMWDGPRFGGKPNDLMMVRSQDQGRTWLGPILPFRVPYGHNSSVLFVPRGSKRIYLFSTEVNPDWGGWPDGGAAMRVSDDDGYSWSPPRLIQPLNGPDYRGQTHIRMTETAAGTWLLGSYRTADLTVPGGRRDRQYLLRSTDQGESWTLIPDAEPNGWFIPEHNYMIEARPLALQGPNVLLWGRAPGGHSWQSRSADDGLTWSPFTPVPLTHPDAPPMLFHLDPPETLIALIHNLYNPAIPKHDHNSRVELWQSLSRDGGRNWSPPRFLLANAARGDGCWGSPQASYCDLLVDGDALHLFVDFQFRQVLHLRFSRQDLENLPTVAELKALA